LWDLLVSARATDIEQYVLRVSAIGPNYEWEAIAMRYGILGPYMSSTSRRQLLEWFRRVDSGPFATIATGERVLWPQVEQQAFLAAAAAVTERVKVMSHIMIVPMHPPVLLAKRLASIDVISDGRLVLGVGTGGRDEDYRAAESTVDSRWARLDDAVSVMRAVWRGEPPWDDASEAVGPIPVQDGGPPVYTSASGPKALARAAKWADGWQGALMSAELDPMSAAVRVHLDAWEAAGRNHRPYLMNSLWFALGEGAEQRLNDAAAGYVHLPAGSSSPFGPLPVHNSDGVKRAVDNCRDAGFDELMFIPVTDDLGELDLLETALDGL
jgi:alkanesulfonate monooxygenase SsuD/methylene tetrahydromethanopterin reductase-like flavin-dependent oxidoreductase (luciferase family)